MLSRFRERYENAMFPIGRAVGSLGIKPNMLSVFAALLGVLASLSYARRIVLLGALILLISTFFDMLDGAVARATKSSSRFGSVLDHVLDRYVEYALVVGIVVGGLADWFWGLFSLTGMLLASYTRAAAESVGGLKSCTIGIAERQEKLLLILVGSALVSTWPSALQYVMIIVGLLSHATVIQRLAYARQNARAF